MVSQYWPLFDLRLESSLLTFSYPSDDELDALIAIVERIREQPGLDWWWKNTADGHGVLEPFATRALQRLWEWRAGWRTTQWTLPLVARLGDDLIGVVEIYSSDFATLKSVEIGIWVDPLLQRRGFGKEMSEVALQFAFGSLGADEARWSSPVTNEASNGLALALGFEKNGGVRLVYVGERFDEHLYRMNREAWELRQRNDVAIQGMERCLSFFGLGSE